MSASIEFCGETLPLDRETTFVIGRSGDLVIDDNPFLHRRFLAITHVDGLWWLANVGDRLSATVADAQGLVNAWLSPGARLPVVFHRTRVWFTAGPTTYDFEIALAGDPPFVVVEQQTEPSGQTTIGRVRLTPEQRLLVLALCEPALRQDLRSPGSLPSSAVAARRLGWPVTKFNRKLDTVCEKLAVAGVRGLHGAPGQLASNRRARLVEYALAVRLVSSEDLSELDETADRPY